MTEHTEQPDSQSHARQPGRSRLVGWCSRLAWACCVAVPSSVLLIRLGVDFRYGLPLFALGCLLSLLVCLALGMACVLPRYARQRGTILRGILPAAPWALLLVMLSIAARPYPPIHDISTNTSDPPLFDAALHQRKAGTNPVDINPAALAIQEQHYPDIQTISSPLDPAAAFDQAVNTAETLGWVIYNAEPAKGIVEASHRSFWFGFIDDIVIRIRPAGQNSRIDLRSVSRVGQGDLGANAQRIRAFAEAYREQ